MIKNKIHKKKYRPCVGIVLIQNGKIFSGQRLDYKSDAWQMPQGGIAVSYTHLTLPTTPVV